MRPSWCSRDFCSAVGSVIRRRRILASIRREQHDVGAPATWIPEPVLASAITVERCPLRWRRAEGRSLLVKDLDAFQSPRLRRSVQLPQIAERSLASPSTVRTVSTRDHWRDPYRPCCADAAAKTSCSEFVIGYCWLLEGWSALHRFF